MPTTNQTDATHNGTATSRAAALRIQPASLGQRASVLNFIREQGERGATDREIQTALNMRGDTQRPRRRELEQAGLVKASGKNRDGCKVWLLAQPTEQDFV